jgi:gliding motility-associated-like protein
MNTVEFVENKGQWQKNIQYKAKIPAGNLYLESNQLTYQFYDEQDIARLHDLHHHLIKEPTERDYLLDLHAFNIEFLSSKTPEIQVSDATSDYVNYYLGNDSNMWASNVKKYRNLSYKNLYKNIDFKFYLKEGYLKYDFLVAPKGNTNEIQLKYNGVDNLYLDKGKLIIKTSVNEIIEQKPYAYQVINGKEKEVKCKFKLTDNVVSFEFPKGYDLTKELIIDPTLIFASYSGSTVDNWGYTSTFDNSGNLYGGGVSFGVGYPKTIGAYQMNFNGGNDTVNFGSLHYLGGTDITLTKFTSNGTSLIYSTYLGGSENEAPHSLIVNNNDELLILGTTSSPDFPVLASSYDAGFNGGVSYIGTTPSYTNGADIVIAKLNSSGTILVGSTYIGGSGNDGLNISSSLNYNYADEFRGEIIVDSLNNVYVASSTLSADFPITPGAVQSVFGGIQDAVVFKIDNNLSAMIWSTYLGGSDGDAAYSLQFDELGNLVFTGGTKSADFPTTSGAYQTVYQGNRDGWVTKIDNNATSILASTFVGTPDYDQSFFVQLDTANNVYLLGQTEGAYPITPSTVYSNPNSGQFLHKLTSNLDSTIFSTTFGTSSGEVDIALSAFLVNECNNILISGWGGYLNSSYGQADFSTTTGLPITLGAIQPITDGNDYYLMLLKENADTLLYSTFFGGNTSADHVDGGTSRFDKRGIVYQAVCASCGWSSVSDFPTTPGAWSPNDSSSNCNLAVFKIDLTSFVIDAGLYTGPIHCFGDTTRFQNLSTGGISYYWDFGDGGSSTAFEPIHVYADSGTYNVMLIASDAVTCVNVDTAFVDVVVQGPDVNVRPDTAVCIGDKIPLWADGGTAHFWNPSLNVLEPSEDTTIAVIVAPTLFILDVITNGCHFDIDVVVDTLPNPTVGLEEFKKANWGDLVVLDLISDGVKFWWSPSEGLNCDTCKNPIVDARETTTYYLTVQGADGCFSYDTVTVLYDGSIYVPNSFTPNGDGKNDIFYAFGEDIVKFEMYIFDRWGEQLFYTDDIEKGWDGMFKGTLAKTETYVWKIKYEDTLEDRGELVGTVTLIR